MQLDVSNKAFTNIYSISCNNLHCKAAEIKISYQIYWNSKKKIPVVFLFDRMNDNMLSHGLKLNLKSNKNYIIFPYFRDLCLCVLFHHLFCIQFQFVD